MQVVTPPRDQCQRRNVVTLSRYLPRPVVTLSVISFRPITHSGVLSPMSSRDPADTVGSGRAPPGKPQGAAAKVPKVARKRTARTPVVAAVEPSPPIPSAGERDSPVADPKPLVADLEPRPGTPVPTAAASPMLSPTFALPERHRRASDIAALTSAVPPDERELEVILNGLVPVEHARLRVSDEPQLAPQVVAVTRTYRLPELERPTLALRQEPRLPPASASASSWVRPQPVASVSPGPFVVAPSRRLAWRRVP